MKNLSPTLEQNLENLISLPEAAWRVQECIGRSDCNNKDIVEAISGDLAITASVLRAANSPMFGFGGRIDSLDRAVLLLGYQRIGEIVLSVGAMKAFSKLSIDRSWIERVWRHGIYTGVVARLLGAKCRIANKERLFVAGMLHDIGLLVRASCKTSNAQMQTELNSIAHDELGGWLLSKWRLPLSIVDAAAMHNAPGSSVEMKPDTLIVRIADAIAVHAGVGVEEDAVDVMADELTWSRLGLSPKIVESMVQVASDEFADIADRFLRSVASAA